MMYVGVMYKNPISNGFSGREYIYATDLPLQVCDKVMCDTPQGEVLAIVSSINLEKPNFDCKVINNYFINTTEGEKE